MRFYIFILITWLLFLGANALLGGQRFFQVDKSFHVVFVTDRNNRDAAPVIIDYDDLDKYIAKYPNHGFIPSRDSGTLVVNRSGEYHRAEYRIERVNNDYSRAEVVYYIRNNKTYSDYLIVNGAIHPLYKRAPRNKMVIAYAVIFVFLALSITMAAVYFLEPHYRKYTRMWDNRFSVYITGNRRVRFFIRGVLFFYLIPVLYFLYEIFNGLKNITDLVLVGILAALALNLIVAVLTLNRRAIKSLMGLVLMVLLFPGRPMF